MERQRPRFKQSPHGHLMVCLLCHRYTGGHSEEDHSQAFPSTSGGQAAQFGFGVRETRALQEEESRFSWEERREGDGEIPLKPPR